MIEAYYMNLEALKLDRKNETTPHIIIASQATEKTLSIDINVPIHHRDEQEELSQVNEGELSSSSEDEGTSGNEDD